MALFCGRSGRRVALDVFCVVALLVVLGVVFCHQYPEVAQWWFSVCAAKLRLSRAGDAGAQDGSLGAYVPGLLYNTPYLGGEDKWLDAR